MNPEDPQAALPFRVSVPVLVSVSGYTQADDRFYAFHGANPEVFRSLHNLAVAMKGNGWKHGAVKLLFERLRWLWAVQTQGDPYKINNNYAPFYARALMSYDPRLEDWFRCRHQPTGDFTPDLERMKLRRREP